MPFGFNTILFLSLNILFSILNTEQPPTSRQVLNIDETSTESSGSIFDLLHNVDKPAESIPDEQIPIALATGPRQHVRYEYELERTLNTDEECDEFIANEKC